MSDIFEDCLKDCEQFREIDKKLLWDCPKEEYDISDDAVEILEETDATGLKLEAHQTNLEECKAHTEKYEKLHHEHVKTCGLDCCKALKEYRIKAGVYEN